tara:strand:- start:670 stop:999 length:330 start_codon:yes stop_codon:yes gene_type:complete
MDIYDEAISMNEDVKNNVNKDKSFKNKMISKYCKLSKIQNLFDKIYRGDFNDKDINILRKMCEVKELRDSGKLDKFDGDKLIGQVVFDAYGPTPEQLEKLKEEKEENDN